MTTHSMSSDPEPPAKIHLGVIPDGNRRWCVANRKGNLDLVQMVRSMYLETMTDRRWTHFEHLRRIGEISVYVLSKDNLTKRNDNTVSMVADLLEFLLADIKDHPVLCTMVSVRFIGCLDLLPLKIREMCAGIEKLTKDGYIRINGAIAYDPIHDVCEPHDADTERSPIDLVIRTGGEQRLSGFFPLQTLYSELFFCSKMFPDLGLYDVDQIIAEYGRRNRRFGA